MGGEPQLESGRYQWFGWTVSPTAGGDVSRKRLVETHEYFHRQLDDVTAFGGLVTTFAALAEARPEGTWADVRDRLQAMSDLLHETFAVGMSLLTTQRQLVRIEGYPLYDRFVGIVLRLVGANVHPWVALAALRAAALACMQGPVLALVGSEALERFDPASLERSERPNHRLVTLLSSDFPDAVAAAHERARQTHGREAWWLGSEGVGLTPESMDGEAGARSQDLHQELFGAASSALQAAGASVISLNAHHGDLAALVRRARELVPEGLIRIGALVEAPDAELLHGGALDSQTIPLSAAPRRAAVLPYGSISGLSGEGPSRHGFVTLVRPDRLRDCYELQGAPLPQASAIACLRSTVFDGEERDSVLFVVVEDPNVLRDETVPIYVSLSSSAAAAAPELAAAWMRHADPSRLSVVMDTPATAALRRWCSAGRARFRTATRRVSVAGMDVWIIAGRVEDGARRSALVVMPTTEFGARWFEAASAEDAVLDAAVVVDADLFEQESAHLDVVLNHLLLEEHVVGMGSWRR